MNDIKWQSPPAHGNTKGRRDWPAVAASLRGRPGEWALVSEAIKFANHSHGIRSGVLAPFRPARSFEARAVKRSDGTFDIYARYVGEVSA